MTDRESRPAAASWAALAAALPPLRIVMGRGRARLALLLLAATHAGCRRNLVRALCTLDTVDGSELQEAEFLKTFVSHNQPVLLTGLTAGWQVSSAWSDHDTLAKAFGSRPLVSRWSEGGHLAGLMTRPVTMEAYLQSMAHPRAGLLFNASSVGLGDLWEVPSMFAAAGMTGGIISVGPEGRGLSMHNHGSTWQAVVRGTKRVSLIPPIPALAVEEGDWPSDLFHRLLHAAPVDVRGMSGELAKLGLPMETCDVGPGETLFIPCNWYVCVPAVDKLRLGFRQCARLGWRTGTIPLRIFTASLSRSRGSGRG